MHPRCFLDRITVETRNSTAINPHGTGPKGDNLSQDEKRKSLSSDHIACR